MPSQQRVAQGKLEQSEKPELDIPKPQNFVTDAYIQ
jgi:hypothetical protein